MSFYAYSWNPRKTGKFLLGEWVWDLTSSQEEIIRALFNFGNQPMVADDIAFEAELNENTTRRVLGEMIKEGLIVKDRDTDGRSIYRVVEDDDDVDDNDDDDDLNPWDDDDPLAA